MMAQITLPWPPKELSPNGSHGHWRVKSTARKLYKLNCLWTIKARGAGYLQGASKFKFVFCPPTKRRMDLDNMIARFKSGGDAIAELCGVDDSDWEVTYVRGESVKGGAVIVEVLV